MLFWQQRELIAEQVSRHRRKDHLSPYTHVCTCTHTHEYACMYKNPNIFVCEYLLTRSYQLPNFSSGEALGIIKILIYLCWSWIPSNPFCLFVLSVLYHTALLQYQKWYANCRLSLKLLHIYPLKYKAFILWIQFLINCILWL